MVSTTRKSSLLSLSLCSSSSSSSFSTSSSSTLLSSSNNKSTTNITIMPSSSSLLSLYKLKHIQQIDQGLYVFQATRKYKTIFKDHRNMVILRHSSREITLINPIRLNEEGERQLRSFGNVRHLIRLQGSSGGEYSEDHHNNNEMMETDVHYLKQYPGACLWAPSSATNPLSHEILDEDKPAPLPRMKVFSFRDTVHPEAALILQRPGGVGDVLITSDVLQSQKYNHLLNMPTRTAMHLGGFLESTVVISPAWLKTSSHNKKGASHLREEFERLLKCDFSKLIGASGNVVSLQAKEEVVLAVEIAFPLWD